MHIVVNTVATEAESEDVLPDGTRILTQVDGTLIQYNTSGIVITTYTNGTVLQKNTDGTEITIYADGSRIQKQEDGTQMWTLITGMTITTHPDGSSIQHDPATGITMLTRVDGVVEQTNPDGIIIVTYPDGSSEQTNPDGGRIKTRPDGVQEDIPALTKAPSVVITTMNTSIPTTLRKSIMSFENNSRIIDITIEDADVDSEDFTVKDNVSCTNGTVKVLPGARQLEFKPPPGFTGESVIKYTVICDGKTKEREAVVHVGKAYAQQSTLDRSFESDIDTGTFGLWRVEM